jgi:uridine kinase
MKFAVYSFNQTIKKYKAAKKPETKQKVAVRFFEEDADIMLSEMLKYQKEVDGIDPNA